ncbi:hypothetical protein SAMN05216299_101243 [Nitrosospira sp. Nsp14]|jgi:hypothetical protein|nr:hypothetical protein SAMN05216299_101243 [Nitrosospira sp. Nsp14]
MRHNLGLVVTSPTKSLTRQILLVPRWKHSFLPACAPGFWPHLFYARLLAGVLRFWRHLFHPAMAWQFYQAVMVRNRSAVPL